MTLAKELSGFFVSNILESPLKKKKNFFKVNFIILLLLLDIHEEAVDSRSEVKTFDRSQLKHVETKEENPLPGVGGKI